MKVVMPNGVELDLTDFYRSIRYVKGEVSDEGFHELALLKAQYLRRAADVIERRSLRALDVQFIAETLRAAADELPLRRPPRRGAKPRFDHIAAAGKYVDLTNAGLSRTKA